MRPDEFAQALEPVVSEELGGQAGSGVALASVDISSAAAGEVLGGADTFVHVRCEAQDGSGDALYVVLPGTAAVALAGLKLEREPDALVELQGQPLDEELVAACGELLSGIGAALGGVLAGMPDRADVAVEPAEQSDDAAWLPEGTYRLLRFGVTLPESLGSGRLDFAIPDAVADRWFDASEDAGLTAGAATNAEEVEHEPSGPLIFVDGSGDGRHQAEALESDLGATVWTLDPVEFGVEMFDEVEDARGFVIAWDLGGRSGLDLLETLVCDPRTRRIPVIVTSAAPTQIMVSTAIRAGAAGFAMQPYDAEELKQRLRGAYAAARRP